MLKLSSTSKMWENFAKAEKGEDEKTQRPGDRGTWRNEDRETGRNGDSEKGDKETGNNMSGRMGETELGCGETAIEKIVSANPCHYPRHSAF